MPEEDQNINPEPSDNPYSPRREALTRRNGLPAEESSGGFFKKKFANQAGGMAQDHAAKILKGKIRIKLDELGVDREAIGHILEDLKEINDVPQLDAALTLIEGIIVDKKKGLLSNLSVEGMKYHIQGRLKREIIRPALAKAGIDRAAYYGFTKKFGSKFGTARTLTNEARAVSAAGKSARVAKNTATAVRAAKNAHIAGEAAIASSTGVGVAALPAIALQWLIETIAIEAVLKYGKKIASAFARVIRNLLIITFVLLFIIIFTIFSAYVWIFKPYNVGGGDPEAGKDPAVVAADAYKKEQDKKFEIKKSVDKPKIEIGGDGNVVYTVKVKNKSETAFNVSKIADDKYQSEIEKCSFASGSIAPNEEKSCEYKVKLDTSKDARVINKVNITGSFDGEVNEIFTSTAFVTIGEVKCGVPCGNPVGGGSRTQGCQAGHVAFTNIVPGNSTYAQDLAVPTGTPIIASVCGRATRIVYSTGNRDGNGIVVTLDSPDGYRLIYAHLLALPSDRPGTSVDLGEVSVGDEVGQVDNTGNSFGTHLHYEIIDNGTRVCPQPYIDNQAQVCKE